MSARFTVFCLFETMNEDWYEKEQRHFVAQDGDLAEVQRLVERGCEVNALAGNSLASRAQFEFDNRI